MSDLAVVAEIVVVCFIAFGLHKALEAIRSKLEKRNGDEEKGRKP
jgi:hypothetical protein